MTTLIVLNLIAALGIAAILVGVSRIAHRVAGGWLDEPDERHAGFSQDHRDRELDRRAA